MFLYRWKVFLFLIASTSSSSPLSSHTHIYIYKYTRMHLVQLAPRNNIRLTMWKTAFFIHGNVVFPRNLVFFLRFVMQFAQNKQSPCTHTLTHTHTRRKIGMNRQKCGAMRCGEPCNRFNSKKIPSAIHSPVNPLSYIYTFYRQVEFG